jgi:hypothetical protein
MSVVTNVMASFCKLEFEQTDFLRKLRAWFEDKGGLASITHGFSDPEPYSWGGNKHPEVELWAGAYNRLDLGAMLGHLEAVDWAWPELAQIFVQEQEEATFCVYMFRDGRLTRVLPYAAWPSGLGKAETPS